MDVNPALSLDGQVIVLTGGVSALGLAVCHKMAEQGAMLVLADIVQSDEAQSRLEQIGVDTARYRYVKADLTHAQAAGEVMQTAWSEFRRLDAVLCNAGTVIDKPLVDFSEAEWDQQLNVNLKTAFLTAQAAARIMIEQSIAGRLLFTTSWVAQVPWPGIGPYNTSKAAMNQLMRSFAMELASHGIRCNAIAPGIVDAGLSAKEFKDDPQLRDLCLRSIPLKRLQTLDSVSDLFLFMCSPMSDYMTGSVLTADGGCSLYPDLSSSSK